MAETRFIAHRGNWQGPNSADENTFDYLYSAYQRGFDVEIDIRAHNGILYFGHDEPIEKANLNFIQRTGVWCHAKDLDALELLLSMRTNCFWHETDTVTLTSDGNIWCYPGYYPRNKKAVWLDLEDKKLPDDVSGIYGICGDYFDKQ
jgi:hypothetical protein